MKTFETYLPVFQGFYETIFSSDTEEDRELENINEIRKQNGLDEIEWDKLEFDHKGYMDRVAKKCCKIAEEELSDMLSTKISIAFDKIVSPMYCNFGNDSVNVDIEIESFDPIFKYLSENMEEFKKHLKDNYSSYDGFISSHSTDPKDWIHALIEQEEIGHKLGSVLGFIMLNEEFDERAMNDKLDGENYIEVTNYEQLTTTENEKQTN